MIYAISTKLPRVAGKEVLLKMNALGSTLDLLFAVSCQGMSQEMQSGTAMIGPGSTRALQQEVTPERELFGAALQWMPRMPRSPLHNAVVALWLIWLRIELPLAGLSTYCMHMKL